MFRNITIFSLLCLLSFGCCQTICHQPGLCQSSYLIGGGTTQTYLECQVLCLDNPDCNYFSHLETNQFCELNFNCSNVDPGLCSDCFTGERDCPTQICSQPGYCQGNIVLQTISESEESCQQLCGFENECQWYTYNEQSNTCILTSNCSPQDVANTVYGQKSCFQGQSKKVIFY